MPSTSPRRASASPVSSSTVRTLVCLFAALAAILFLVAFFSPHSVLFPPGPNFEDIIVYRGRFTLYHTAKFFTSRAFSGFAYPAGAAPIYEAFYATHDAVNAYCIVAAIASLAALVLAFVALARAKAATLFLPLCIAACFPLLFLIQRANIEIVLWIIVAAGLIAYRQRLPYLAAVLFGLGAAVKFYPILLLGLFLRPAARRSRSDLPAFLTGILTAIVSMTAAIAYAGPTFFIAARGFFTGVSHFQDHYVDTVTRVELVWDHCLFAFIKYWAYTQHTSPAPFTHLYLLFAGAFALALFLRVRALPFLNRAVFLTVAMVCLPPVSFTYTLVHLYVPLVLLLCLLAKLRTTAPSSALLSLALLLYLMLPIVSLSALSLMPFGISQAIALFLLLILPTLTPWPITQPADAL